MSVFDEVITSESIPVKEVISLKSLLVPPTPINEGLFFDLEKESRAIDIEMCEDENKQKQNIEYSIEGSTIDVNEGSSQYLSDRELSNFQNVGATFISGDENTIASNNFHIHSDREDNHEHNPQNLPCPNIYQEIDFSHQLQPQDRSDNHIYGDQGKESFKGELYCQNHSLFSGEILGDHCMTLPSQRSTHLINNSHVSMTKGATTNYTDEFNETSKINSKDVKIVCDLSNSNKKKGVMLCQRNTVNTQISLSHLLQLQTSDLLNEIVQRQFTKPLKSDVKYCVMKYKTSVSIPVYGKIRVIDPILIGSHGIFGKGIYWSYSITTNIMRSVEDQRNSDLEVTKVRRRFRHFVTLEERIRDECPGAILPPRPDKHPIRSLEEISPQKSSHFAIQRAKALEIYLNYLRLHPLVGKSDSLKTFLTFPDDIGAIWSEVNVSIFTRLSEVSTSTIAKVAQSTSSIINELNSEIQVATGEDNVEILALSAFEQLRIRSVTQAVPKIECVIPLIRIFGERLCVVGLELQKLVKNVLVEDIKLSIPFEVLSSGLIQSGRRTVRLATELETRVVTFSLQHKLCKYERLAFSDRVAALTKRRNASVYLTNTKMGLKEEVEEGFVSKVIHQADVIGMILQLEVGRISDIRRKEWSESLRVMLLNLKECCTERIKIWEACKSRFEKKLITDKTIPLL